MEKFVLSANTYFFEITEKIGKLRMCAQDWLFVHKSN